MSKVYEIEGAEIKVVSGEFTENKSIAKAQNNGWIVNNTTAAHIANGIEKLNSQYVDGTLIKKVIIKSNSKLDGIPTIGFTNIFITIIFKNMRQIK